MPSFHPTIPRRSLVTPTTRFVTTSKSINHHWTIDFSLPPPPQPYITIHISTPVSLPTHLSICLSPPPLSIHLSSIESMPPNHPRILTLTSLKKTLQEMENMGPSSSVMGKRTLDLAGDRELQVGEGSKKIWIPRYLISFRFFIHRGGQMTCGNVWLATFKIKLLFTIHVY